MDALMTLALDPAAWAALLTLVTMEIVLGIDNLIFISILTNKLPEAMRAKARFVGLTGALLMRILLLGHGFSWRDIILIVGGLFLVYKATSEIIEHTEPKPKVNDEKPSKPSLGFGMAIVQILMLDLVFSIDSILTAVGMTDHLPIMILAVLITVAIMFAASTPIANFIARHASIVVLALGFLLMIGTVLIMEGMGLHIDKGYIYAAMAFAGFVEALQMFHRRKHH